MILWIIILILTIIIFVLSISVFIIIKKASYLSKKQKDFIIFAIDMYIDYSEELGITSKQQHDIIVNNLKEIKDKHLNEKI